MLVALWKFLLKPVPGVYLHVADDDLPMQVRPGDATRGANQTDYLAGLDTVPDLSTRPRCRRRPGRLLHW